MGNNTEQKTTTVIVTWKNNGKVLQRSWWFIDRFCLCRWFAVECIVAIISYLSLELIWIPDICTRPTSSTIHSCVKRNMRSELNTAQNINKEQLLNIPRDSLRYINTGDMGLRMFLRDRFLSQITFKSIAEMTWYTTLKF